jgi:hypothetical protein
MTPEIVLGKGYSPILTYHVGMLAPQVSYKAQNCNPDLIWAYSLFDTNRTTGLNGAVLRTVSTFAGLRARFMEQPILTGGKPACLNLFGRWIAGAVISSMGGWGKPCCDDDPFFRILLRNNVLGV